MRKLLTPRWLAGHVLAGSLIVLFLNLGWWQWQRHQARQTQNTMIEAARIYEPQPYTSLLTTIQEEATQATDTTNTKNNVLMYRQATLQGFYDTAETVLLRSRAYQGEPGFHVLTPFAFAPNRAILVNRGWIPFDHKAQRIDTALPLETLYYIVGELHPTEHPPEGFGAKDPEEGELTSVFWIDRERLNAQVPYALEPYYLTLTNQTPAPTDYPIVLSPEAPEGGNHLSYALQWLMFALVGIIGYIFLMRSIITEQAQES